jgi:hypothetical protein
MAWEMAQPLGALDLNKIMLMLFEMASVTFSSTTFPNFADDRKRG